MSRPTKRIFLSDIHLGPPNNEANWFEKSQHTDNLVACLDWVAEHGDDIKDLVFLGDLVDTWLTPIDEQPPEPIEIIEHHSEVRDAVRRCVGEVNVFHLNGNHDMHVDQQDLEPFASGGERVEQVNCYRAGRLYAEHGHRFAMFNARDKLHDSIHGLPVGYFISRVLASGNTTHESPKAFLQGVDDIMEAAFTSDTLIESVLEHVIEYVDEVELDDEVTMPFGRSPLTLEEVQEKYAPLYDRWVDKFGQWYALHAARAEFGSLEWFARRLCDQKDYKAVILGHTHNPQAEHDRALFETGELYANSGYWCTDQPAMVEVDKRPDAYEVSLYHFEEGQKHDEPFANATV